jgi:hypothetical protein
MDPCERGGLGGGGVLEPMRSHKSGKKKIEMCFKGPKFIEARSLLLVLCFFGEVNVLELYGRDILLYRFYKENIFIVWLLRNINNVIVVR